MKTLSIFLSLRVFRIFHLQVSFLSLHSIVNGIFPVLMYTHHVYVGKYYNINYYHELSGIVLDNKILLLSPRRSSSAWPCSSILQKSGQELCLKTTF